MSITLYKGTTCPKCNVIATKLNQKGIEYQVITDIDYMMSVGVKTVPTLEVDGQRYIDVKACNEWIKSVGGAQ